MSSCTSYYAAPAVPAPPPLVTSTGAGHSATSVCGILGSAGCQLIRETLTDLARGSSSKLLKELAEGQPAAVADLSGWKQSAKDPAQFTREVAGVEITVNTGGAALETQFQFRVTDTRALTQDELTERAAVIQKQANRAVNKVLAVAVAKQVIEQKIREKVKVGQRIQVRATNNAAVQLTCIAPINH